MQAVEKDVEQEVLLCARQAMSHLLGYLLPLVSLAFCAGLWWSRLGCYLQAMVPDEERADCEK